MESYILCTNGEKKVVRPKNGTDFKLVELQGFVGGYIEVVTLDNGRIMVVNEEGKLLGLDYNIGATNLVYECGIKDLIVGDVLVCDDDMVR